MTTVEFTVMLDEEERYYLYKDAVGSYVLRTGCNVVMFDHANEAIHIMETAVKRIREYEKAIKDTPSVG